MQLELRMTNQPSATNRVWATLSEQQRTEVLQALAQLIANAATAQLAKEEHDHEQR